MGPVVAPSDARSPLLGRRPRGAACLDVLPALLCNSVFGYMAGVTGTVMPLWSARWGSIGPVAGGAINSVSMLGSVVGMYAFGCEAISCRSGDALVRLACFAALLCFFCGVLSAFFPAEWVEVGVEKGGANIFGSFAGWAILLTRAGSGVGGGGLFTLGATMEDRRNPGVGLGVGLVSLGISFGSMLVYVNGALLVSIFGERVDVQWRLMFLLGAALAAAAGVALVLRGHRDGGGGGEARPVEQKTLCAIAGACRDHGRSGSLSWLCGSWFLQNVGNFGLASIFPYILEDAIPGLSLEATFWVSAALGALALLAAAGGAAAMARHPAAPADAAVEVYGVCVILMAVASAAWGIESAATATMLSAVALWVVLRIVFGAPVAALYAYPMTAAPPDVAAAVHGTVSGVAKLGSIVGTVAYYPIYAIYGRLAILLVSAVLLLGGFACALAGANAAAGEDGARKRVATNKARGRQHADEAGRAKA